MTDSTWGALASVSTALVWASSVILFTRSGEHVGPYALNLFKNLISLPLFAFTLWWSGEGAGEVLSRDTWVFLGSGALGIGVADVLFFAGLNRLGAGRIAIVDCLYSPSVVLFAFLYLGESLSPLHALGAVLVLSAVVLGAREEPSSTGASSTSAAGRADLALVSGLLFGGGAVVLMAAAIVWVKPVLVRHSVVWAVTARMVGGVLLQLLPLAFLPSLRAEVACAFRPHPGQRFAIPGAILGTYFALLLWIYGFKYTSAGIAGILNQTSTLFVVLLATVFLGERLTPRRALAVGLAFAGILLVLL